MSWFVAVLRQYATFRGRAGRREFWSFALVYLLIALVLALLDDIAGTGDGRAGGGLLSSLFALGTLLPSLAVAVRRLHDTGRSGGWLLLLLVPVIGWLLLLLLFALKGSEPGDNAYGRHPSLEPQP
ncbi:MAG: DUF805 domain-containing protein [Burkholderiaceae bacterium]|nr:DUF805 domain-containing protein [Burkholderiaceae bacterium]